MIDLTDTDKYYNHDDFDCEVLKIKCRGRWVPSREWTKNIHAKIDQLVSDNQQGYTVIGIHCTHGINRTGFVICSYLAELSGNKVGIEEIIKMFNESRSEPITRQYLIDALMKRYLVE